jgi:protein phosphatase
MIQRIFDIESSLFLENTSLFLKESVMVANKVLGAFSKANQEKYAGFIASISVCLLHKNELHFVHTGNTRIYHIRRHPQDGYPNIRQLTRDQTKAMSLVYDGIINEFQYHTHPGRLTLTSCIGNTVDPELQIFDIKLQPEDILLMTTDGIHYSLQPDPMAQLIMESENCETAVNALVQACIMEKYIDNMSAIMIYLLPDA